MNYAPAKVIYIIGGEGRLGWVGGGISPSNTDTKQHFLPLIINITQGAHTPSSGCMSSIP